MAGPLPGWHRPSSGRFFRTAENRQHRPDCLKLRPHLQRKKPPPQTPIFPPSSPPSTPPPPAATSAPTPSKTTPHHEHRSSPDRLGVRDLRPASQLHRMATRQGRGPSFRPPPPYSSLLHTAAYNPTKHS